MIASMPRSTRRETPSDPVPEGVSGGREGVSGGREGASAGRDGVSGGREPTRRRVIEAAAGLLAREGREAVTTRAVAAAAGVQPPAIYRHFDDMDGLLDAVAEHGYARFLEAKQASSAPDDPVEDLRAGWDLAVEFGLANPALYAMMYGEPRRGTDSAAFRTGMEILLGRIRRLAAAGRLRVAEPLAAALVHATARGAVLTWLSLPEDGRDPALLTAMREAMVTAVTTESPAVQDPGPAGAARALRAVLPQQTALSEAEQHLLGEWLDRLSR